eukprot:251994-Rhodomonas_salina.2
MLGVSDTCWCGGSRAGAAGGCGEPAAAQPGAGADGRGRRVECARAAARGHDERQHDRARQLHRLLLCPVCSAGRRSVAAEACMCLLAWGCVCVSCVVCLLARGRA